MINNGFGPQNKKEEIIFFEENFRIDIQTNIRNIMSSKRIDNCLLAQRMNVGLNYIEKIFSDDFDISVRELAKIYYALGECSPNLLTTEFISSF